MGAFASGLQGVGQAASDFGQAKFDFSNWQQQQRANRLNEIIQGLRIQQIQNQLKQMNLPQSLGLFKGPQGEYGGAYDPTTGEQSAKLLVPAAPAPNPEAMRAAAYKLADQLPGDMWKLGRAGFDMLAGPGIPQPNYGEAFKFVSGLAQKFGTQELKPLKPAKVSKYENGIPTEVEDEHGVTYSAYDPSLPPNLKTLVQAGEKSHSRHLEEEERLGAERDVRSLSKAEQLIKMREDQKIQADAIKASQVARDAKIGLDTARQHAARKESYSDLSLIYTAVRSNVQGAGRMTQTEILQALQAGSFGDVWKRRYENTVKGTLPEEDRQKILHEVEDAYRAKRQAGQQAWEQGFPDKVMPPWLRKSPDEEADEYTPKK